MLGFSSISIFLAYFLTVVASLTCIIYGVINWNKGGDPDDKEIQQEKQWLEEEKELDSEMS